MKSRFLALSTVSLAFGLTLSAFQAQAPASLTLDLNRTKAPVSSTLYGLMTEEINYSYDGGLYAELVSNRTFRSDWSGILNWYLVEKGQASAKMCARQKRRTLRRTDKQRQARGHQSGRKQPGGPAERRLLGNRRASERTYKGSSSRRASPKA